MLKCAVPWRILSFISSRKPFDKANATISAATPIQIPSTAANDVARAKRRLRRDLKYLNARNTSYGIGVHQKVSRVTFFPGDTSSCLQAGSQATSDSNSDCHAQSGHPSN